MRTQRFKGHGGLEICTTVAGNPQHPSVILLHGGGQTRHSWGTAQGALAASRHFVIAADLRGHGESEWAADHNYSMEAHVGDLLSIIRHLDTRPALVGASLGGLISLLAAGEQNIARALVLVDVAPKMNQVGIAKIRGFMEANPEGFDSINQAADVVAAYLPHRPRPKDTSGLARNLRLGKDGRYRWHWDPALQTPRPQSLEPRYEAAARQVDIPTLLVRGALSEIVDKESEAHFKSLLPSAETVEVRGANHMVAGDQNDQFNTAVIDFLLANPHA